VAPQARQPRSRRPQIAPVMAQAILKITGKRIRSLPFGKQDLSWA
jgi:CO/xanthine dehydrogenase Mo-binding subunit